MFSSTRAASSSSHNTPERFPSSLALVNHGSKSAVGSLWIVNCLHFNILAFSVTAEWGHGPNSSSVTWFHTVASVCIWWQSGWKCQVPFPQLFIDIKRDKTVSFLLCWLVTLISLVWETMQEQETSNFPLNSHTASFLDIKLLFFFFLVVLVLSMVRGHLVLLDNMVKKEKRVT